MGMGAIFGNVGNCGRAVTSSGRLGACVGALTTGGNVTLDVVVGAGILGVVVGPGLLGFGLLGLGGFLGAVGA